MCVCVGRYVVLLCLLKVKFSVCVCGGEAAAGVKVTPFAHFWCESAFVRERERQRQREAHTHTATHLDEGTCCCWAA